MAVEFAKPVEDSVEKINQEVAVGEDLEFQNRWWKFERVVWVFFLIVLGLDLCGLFGRGPLAHARLESADHTLSLKYDRIERTGTPSIMDISFGASAIHNGAVNVYISESIVKELGAQRVAPQPAVTELGDGGLTYTFPASKPPAAVQFALQPSAPGIYHFTLKVPGTQGISARVIVVP